MNTWQPKPLVGRMGSTNKYRSNLFANRNMVWIQLACIPQSGSQWQMAWPIIMCNTCSMEVLCCCLQCPKHDSAHDLWSFTKSKPATILTQRHGFYTFPIFPVSGGVQPWFRSITVISLIGSVCERYYLGYLFPWVNRVLCRRLGLPRKRV